MVHLQFVTGESKFEKEPDKDVFMHIQLAVAGRLTPLARSSACVGFLTRGASASCQKTLMMYNVITCEC